MFDLDAKFNELVNKYNVIVSDEGVIDVTTLHNSYVKMLSDVLSSFGKDEPIGIYGLGQNAEEFFKIIGDENDYNIVCLIDNDTSKKDYFEQFLGYLNIPIIQSVDIKKYSPKKIVITHLNSRKAIKQHVKELYPDIECFDIYEMLEEKGIDCSDIKQPFWDIHYHFLRYFLVKNQMVYDYKVTGDLDEKEKLLKKIISMHLRLRDFYNADLFIRDYIFLDFKDKERYISFSKELSELFKDARKVMQSKNNKNILMFVPDSLSKEDVENMSYLKALAEEKGFVFENAICAANWTTQSFKSIFTGKTGFEDELYTKKKLVLDDCKSLKSLDEKGYKLKIYGHIGGKKEFNEINFIYESNQGIKQIDYEEITVIYWRFLCDYLKDDKKVFYIIHTLVELHVPHINNLYKNVVSSFPMLGGLYDLLPDFPLPEFTDSDVRILNENYTRQICDCAEYVDKQMEFYFKFINFKNDMIIVMGDHGNDQKSHWEEHARKYHKGKPTDISPFKILFNPAFMIFDKGIENGTSNDIFSYIDILKLINNVVKGNHDISVYKREYAVADCYPLYNEHSMKIFTYLNHGHSRYGFTVVYTANEKFVSFLNGVQAYYILPNDHNDEDNVINDPKYNQRVAFFRKIISHVNPREILSSDTFNNAREFLELNEKARLQAEEYIKKLHEDNMKKPSLLDYKLKRKK